MKSIKLILTFLLFSTLAIAKNYFVSPNGNASNSGLTVSSALNTIQAAANKTIAGDTVFIMNGTYINYTNGTNVVNINNSGSVGNYIVYKNFPGHNPTVRVSSKNWAGIQIQGADYIIIDGLTVLGNNDSILLSYAISQKLNLSNPKTSGNGIGCAPQYNNTANKSHHIIVRNCNISKCPGGGIYFTKSDYVTVENNTVSECAWYSPYANSGISLYQQWNSDSSTAIKNFILGNTCFRNEEYVPFYTQGYITDGNGIIIDDSRNTQNNSTLGKYIGKFYIANNVVFDNGGRGIHVYSSDNVQIINNTCFQNCQSPSIVNAEFTAYEADHISFINNISYSKNNIAPIATNNTVSNLTVSNNLWGNNWINATPFGINTLTGTPLFINASTNATLSNFRINASSPAINSGNTIIAPVTDKDGFTRLLNGTVDLGAYEYNTYPSSKIVPEGNIALCASEMPVSLSAITNKSGATYLWKRNGNPITPIQSNSTITVAQAGNYSVVVSFNGHSTESKPTKISVKPVITSVLDTAVCTSFKWNNITYYTSGTYSKSFVSSVGCDSTAILRLRISKPIITYQKKDALCYGSSTGSIIISGSNGIPPYMYRLGATGSYTKQDSFLNLKASNVYRINVQDSIGCTAYISNVVIGQFPAINVNPTVIDADCNGSSTGKINVSASAGIAPYQYRISNGNLQTSPVFNGLKAGIYNLTVLDTRNCTSSVNVTVKQPIPVNADYSYVSPICYNTTTGTLTFSGKDGKAPYTYRLGTTGSFTTSNTFQNLKGGTYTIYIKDSIGCIGKKTSVLPQPSPITLSFNKVDANCSNPKGSINLVKSAGPSNPPYQYMLTGFPNYTSNNVYVNLTPKSYIGYIKDSLGCTAKTTTITILPSSGCREANDSVYNNIIKNSLTINEFKLLDNPTIYRFELEVKVYDNEAPYNLQVADINGKVVYELFHLTRSDIYRFGEDFIPGIYFIKIFNDSSVNYLKGIKIN